MGISLPTDIVLDVAKAADPAKYQAAAKRLSEMSGTAGGADFANMIDGAGRRFLSHVPVDPYGLRTSLRNETALVETSKKNDPYQQFEAFILQNFIETMLPKDSEEVFGKGTAGGVWKSMLAEQIGTQIAKAGGIGVAKHVFSARTSTEMPRAGAAAMREKS